LRQGADDGRNPRDIKFELARELVGRFHGDAAAAEANESFIKRFKDKAMPDDIEAVTVSSEGGALGLAQLLRQAQLVPSNSEGMRMIQQGAVRIDGERVEDRKLEIKAGTTHIYQVGKRRFARVTLS